MVPSLIRFRWTTMGTPMIFNTRKDRENVSFFLKLTVVYGAGDVQKDMEDSHPQRWQRSL